MFKREKVREAYSKCQTFWLHYNTYTQAMREQVYCATTFERCLSRSLEYIQDLIQDYSNSRLQINVGDVWTTFRWPEIDATVCQEVRYAFDCIMKMLDRASTWYGNVNVFPETFTLEKDFFIQNLDNQVNIVLKTYYYEELCTWEQYEVNQTCYGRNDDNSDDSEDSENSADSDEDIRIQCEHCLQLTRVSRLYLT